MRKHLLYRLAKHEAPGGCAALHNIPVGMRSVKSMRSIAHTKLYPNLPLLSRKIPIFFRTNWVAQDVVVIFPPFNNTIRFSAICGESVEIFLLQYKYRIALWRFFWYNACYQSTMLMLSCFPGDDHRGFGACLQSPGTQDQGNGFLRLWGILCMRSAPLHPLEPPGSPGSGLVFRPPVGKAGRCSCFV